ncbi:MAG: hypothetical protein QM778_25390 [Myxococcales bacterium]
MSNPNNTVRKSYSEPRLEEYGALTDLTRSSLLSMNNQENLKTPTQCQMPNGDRTGPKPC